MIIVLAGASGFLGTPLKQRLRTDGHELRTLVRRPPKAPDEFQWAPETEEFDSSVLDGAGAVINLCGVGVGDKRWTDAYKLKIVESRVDPSRMLAEAISERGADAPGVLLNASAVGFYGETGDRPTDESAPQGTGFLADVVGQWEAATAAAQTEHTRVVFLRTGLPLAKEGGLLGKIIPLVKFGLGGPLGSGHQFWPWISLDDELGAISFLLDADVAGPVNLTGPDPVTEKAFMQELGRQLHRPTVLPAPGFALRLVLGEFADEGVLVSQRVVPNVLTDAGYTFIHPTLAGAVSAALA